MPVPQRWVGIDQGYSQMGLAVIDATGKILAVHRTREPRGNGHDRDVALARLHRLLARVDALRDAPVHLAGYCYEHSGVAEAFADAGWTVAGQKALNDVVGVYGLTPMPGHVVVACCGTFSQAVYIDERQAVRWPGGTAAAQLPEWPLCGQAYADFLVNWSRNEPASPTAKAVRAILGHTPEGGSPEPTADHWADLGPLLSDSLEHPTARAFLAQAAAAVVETRNVFWRHAGTPQPCDLVLGGGAVADDRLWSLLAEHCRTQGLHVHRAAGEPSVGLARYALSHPEADPWSFIGDKPPDWLSS